MPQLRDLVSKNVRTLRIRNNMTQQALAEKTALRVSYISRLENEPQNVTLDHLELLADGLSVPVTRLVSGEAPLDAFEREFVEDFDRLLGDLGALRRRILRS